MQIDYEAIRQRIKNARKILGYTQEELATKMNLQQYEISKIETAKKGSGIDNLEKLQMFADHLEVSLDYLQHGRKKLMREDKNEENKRRFGCNIINLNKGEIGMVCRYLRTNPEKVKLKDLEAYGILIEDDGERRVYLITEPFPIGDSDDDIPPIEIITILCISQADDDVVGKMRGFLINGYFLFLEPREAFTTLDSESDVYGEEALLLQDKLNLIEMPEEKLSAICDNAEFDELGAVVVNDIFVKEDSREEGVLKSMMKTLNDYCGDCNQVYCLIPYTANDKLDYVCRLETEEEIERNKKIALKMGLMVGIVDENPYAYHINDYEDFR